MTDPTRRTVLTAVAISSGTFFSGCVTSPSATNNNPPDSPSATPTSTRSRTASTPDKETPDETETPTDTHAEETPTETEPEETATEQPDSNWYIRPDGKPRYTPAALECEEEGTNRYEQRFQETGLVWGDANGWQLRVETLSVEYGETITIRLKNTANTTRNRGVNSKYNLQVKTNEGWQDIRVWHDENGRPVPPAEAITHESGETHDWTITMDEDSHSAMVCPDLDAGRYRFAYYGFEGSDNPDAIAVAFDLKTS